MSNSSSGFGISTASADDAPDTADSNNSNNSNNNDTANPAGSTSTSTGSKKKKKNQRKKKNKSSQHPDEAAAAVAAAAATAEGRGVLGHPLTGRESKYDDSGYASKTANNKLNNHPCDFCNDQIKPKSRCSGCQVAVYCGRECQSTHWPEHKIACKALAAAVKASAGELGGDPADLYHNALAHATARRNNAAIKGYRDAIAAAWAKLRRCPDDDICGDVLAGAYNNLGVTMSTEGDRLGALQMVEEGVDRLGLLPTSKPPPRLVKETQKQPGGKKHVVVLSVISGSVGKLEQIPAERLVRLRGSLLESLGRAADAKKFLLAAMELGSSYETCVKLGIVMHRLNELEECLALRRKTVERFPHM